MSVVIQIIYLATWTCLLGESELLLAEADEDSAAEEVAVEDGEVLGEAAGEAAEGGQQQGAHSGRVTVWRGTVEAINILGSQVYSLLYCPHAVRW